MRISKCSQRVVANNREVKKAKQVADEKTMGVQLRNSKLKKPIIGAQPELAIMESDLNSITFNDISIFVVISPSERTCFKTRLDSKFFLSIRRLFHGLHLSGYCFLYSHFLTRQFQFLNQRIKNLLVIL